MQLRAVQQIIALVAKDSPLEKVTRVGQAFQNVLKRQNSKGESLKKFAARFQGLAQSYLRVSGATQKDHLSVHDAAGMVLALSFIANTNLQPETRNQVQLQLSQCQQLDAVPLKERTFLCDDFVIVDEYDGRTPETAVDDSDDEGLPLPDRAARHELRLFSRADEKYEVPARYQ